MQNNDLEFSISQYLDGNLPPAEVVAFESRLAQDPDAQALVAQYRRLNAALRSMPMPAVRWDVLAQSISTAVDAAQEEQTTRVYRMPFWVRMAVPLSLAASVMIAMGLGMRMFMGHGKPHHGEVAAVDRHRPDKTNAPLPLPSDGSAAQGSSLIVIGPETEKPAGPIEVEVSAGPSADANYSQDVVSRPSSVTIASGMVPVHEDAGQLFMDMQ